jgi:SNF2 family DNA or RNA helicase
MLQTTATIDSATILTLIGKLRQICNHPAFVDDPTVRQVTQRFTPHSTPHFASQLSQSRKVHACGCAIRRLFRGPGNRH